MALYFVRIQMDVRGNNIKKNNDTIQLLKEIKNIMIKFE